MKVYVPFILGLFTLFACTKDDPNPVKTDPVEVAQNISTETVWEDVNKDPAAFDYIIKKSELIISAGLTIQPGVVVGCESSCKLVIEDAGWLNAVGTAVQPIRFTGTVNAAGFWDGILFNSPDVRNELTYCIIEHAGGATLSFLVPKAGVGLIDYGGDGKLNITHTIFQNNEGYGFASSVGTELLKFGANTFEENTAGALQIIPSSVSKLDQATNYGTTNGFNGVEILKGKVNALTPQTWLALPGSARYRFFETLEIQSGLTIQAGAVIEAGTDAAIYIQHPGYLVAIGTPDNRISFEGQLKQAGTWRGIVTDSEDIRSKLAYCTIAHGGGGKLPEMNSLIANVAVANAITHQGYMAVENCILKDGAGCGIAAESATTLLQSGNTFSGLIGNSVCN
jgi:hypothetical protein